MALRKPFRAIRILKPILRSVSPKKSWTIGLGVAAADADRLRDRSLYRPSDRQADRSRERVASRQELIVFC